MLEEAVGWLRNRDNTKGSCLVLEIRNTSTTTKTWVAYGNSSNYEAQKLHQKYILEFVFGSMKWWQNHFDVITILTIWRQDYRKEKEESKETRALEVRSKNDKTEKID